MLLYLVRHAAAAARDATQWPDDADRPLTRKGKRRFRRAVRGMARLGIKPDAVLSSRYARAWRTAELLAKEAKWPAPVACPELEGSGRPAEALAALRVFDAQEPAAAAFVGHEPGLSELASYLLTGDPDRARIDLKKGAVACLDVHDEVEPARATLLWVAQPKLLRSVR